MNEHDHEQLGGLLLLGDLIDNGLIEGPWRVNVERCWQVFSQDPKGDRHSWVVHAMKLTMVEGELAGRTLTPIEEEELVPVQRLLYEAANRLEERLTK